MVEEKRGVSSGVGGAYWTEGTPPPSPTTDRWRLTATAKMVGSRVVVQPWHKLHTLVLSHNLLTHLDDSLQVLPALKEVSGRFAGFHPGKKRGGGAANYSCSQALI